MSDNNDDVNERSRQLREQEYLNYLEQQAGRARGGDDDSSDEEGGNEEDEQDGQEVDQPYEQLGDGDGNEEDDEEFGEFSGPVTSPIIHQMDDATLFQTVLDNLDRREKVGASSMSDDDALFASSKPAAQQQQQQQQQPASTLAPLEPEKRALIMSAMQNFKPKGGARPALDFIADSIVKAHQQQVGGGGN